MNQKNTKKTCIMILFLIFQSTVLFSSRSQEPDTLIYNGVRYNLHTDIIHEYFSQYPEKRPTSEFRFRCSTNWRGYNVIYELVDNEVWVTSFSLLCSRKNFIPEIFDGKDREKAYWFTGRLIASYGESHVRFLLCENYLLIDIRNGNFVREARLTTEEYILYLQGQFDPFDN